MLALVTCAYLAAFYLTMEAIGNEPLQEDFRRRGLIACAVLGVLGPAALPVARLDAPYMWESLSRVPVIVFFGVASLALAASFVFMYTRRYGLARAAAILEVVAIFGAWASAQFSLPPRLRHYRERRGIPQGNSHRDAHSLFHLRDSPHPFVRLATEPLQTECLQEER